jgi:lysophospholipase L1-like esterase
MNQPEESRLKTILFSVLAVGIGCVLLVVLAELTVRYLDTQQQERSHENPMGAIFRANPEGTGSFRLKENYAAMAELEGHTISVELNSHGMHWREVALEKPAGRQRIAFVGDSFTFGQWATTYEESFVGVFASLADPNAFEVLNFGVPAYGFPDMELQIEEQVLSFDPDFVVIVMFTGNDFQDTYLGLEKNTIVEDGRLGIDQDLMLEKLPREVIPMNRLMGLEDASEPATGSEPFSLREALSNLALLQRARATMDSWTSDEEDLFFDSLNVQHETFFWSTYFSRKQYSPLAEAAKEDVLASLARIEEILSARGIQLMIASVPFKDQVYADVPETDTYDVALPQTHVGNFAAAHSIPYYDTLPFLRDYVRSTDPDVFFQSDGHFNDLGYRIVGEELFRWFEATVGAGSTTAGERIPVSIEE